MNTLVPMTAAQFDVHRQQLAIGYADDKVQAGQWAAKDALALAHQTLTELLPQGLATPDHYFYAMQAGSAPEPVGSIWICAQLRGEQRVAYIYDVMVHEANRRQGHATWAFAALELEVQRLGLAGVALHVFGHNTGARALYAKLGYQVTNVNMYKALTPGG